MKRLYALSFGVIGAMCWAQVAMAGGPTMPCETGGTLHLTKKAAPQCSGDDCTKLVAVNKVARDASQKK